MYLFIYLFIIWLCWVLVAAGRLLSCSMRTLSCGMHVGSSFPRDRTRGPLHWRHGVLTTAPSGKSRGIFKSQGFLSFQKVPPKAHDFRCLQFRLA